MYKPKYRVEAGGYRGEFDLPLEGLKGFLQKVRPDPFWGATSYKIISLATGEVIEEIPVPQSGISAYE